MAAVSKAGRVSGEEARALVEPQPQSVRVWVVTDIGACECAGWRSAMVAARRPIACAGIAVRFGVAMPPAAARFL